VQNKPVQIPDKIQEFLQNLSNEGVELFPYLANMGKDFDPATDTVFYSGPFWDFEEVKAAMEGMLDPEFEEKITSNVEIREVFKITKVGTIAGCMVLDGKITRNSKVRIIRDGVVVYTGELASLKRFKDDVKEVATGYECGLNIQNFNNIEVGDIVESYEQVEVKRKL
jgi:translation initiation factor IF-2